MLFGAACMCGSRALELDSERERNREGSEGMALGASCNSAATFCFGVRGFYTRQECGPHRHKIATDGEEKRS